MSSLRDFHVFPNSLVMGPGIARVGGSYLVGVSEAEASATLTVTVSAAAPVGDPYWSSVSLCINASGADGSTAITDAKSSTLTLVGNTQIDTSLGYPAIEFDGLGDYISVTSAPPLVLGTEDFTIEAFMYVNTFEPVDGANRCLLAKGTGYSGGWSWLFLTDGRIAWYDTTTRFTFSVAIPLATMTHVCVTRESGVFRAFVGGVAAGGLTASINLSSTAALLIGTSLTSTGWFDGRSPAVRITKGVARWTSTFTPPEYPFPTT